MAVKHVLLGLVIEEAAHGGELDRRFAERFGFWRPSSTSHRDLGWLRNRGYIRPVDGEAPGGPQSVRYEATPEGVAFFEAWLRAPVGTGAPPLRSELLMKVRFPTASDELLQLWYREARAQEQWCINRMQALAEVPADLQALAERQKEMPVLSPLLLREAESIYLNTTVGYLALVMRALRRLYETRTGRPLEA